LENSIDFYYSKVRLNLLFIISLLFVVLSIFIIYFGITDRVFLIVPIAFLLLLFFGYYSVVYVLALISKPPYITFRETAMQFGKDWLVIDYDQIDSIFVRQGVFRIYIEIVVSNQNKVYEQTSFSTEVMMGSSERFVINHKLIPKRKRPQLFKTLDYIMKNKDNQVKESFMLSELKDISFISEQAFVNKYDENPPASLTIDKLYIIMTLAASFLYLLFFSFFYFFLVRNEFYLFYIMISFFTFPFAKAHFDWMGVYKLRQKIDNEPFPDHHYIVMKIIFDGLLYLCSIFILPLSLLFFLIRYIIKRVK